MDKGKLTPEQQFWINKTLEFAKNLYDQSENQLVKAYNVQDNNRDNLLNQIAKILLSYNISDNVLSLSAFERKKLYSELSDLIVKNFKSELDLEHNLTKNILVDVGKQKYNTNNYLYSLGADFKITQLPDEALEKIINTKVEDKLWSDRLYDNKNNMCKVLRNEIKKFLKGDTNVNNIENVIKDKYKINTNETKRLVQDNICRVQEGANDQWQHAHNIEYVMYMATLDGKVCHLCAPYDAKVFELNKKPVEIPQHPFCRCVYVSLPNKDWKPKMRLDNETKENINWQSYQEWYKNYIENNPERLLNHQMIKNKPSDSKLYKKYKNILGKEMPKTLEDFQKLKYNNVKEWSTIQDYYKARAQGNISSFSSYGDYKSVINDLSKKLIGAKTSDGIKIKSFSKHMIDRILGASNDPKTGLPRSGTTVEGVLDALKNPIQITEVKSRKLDKVAVASKKYIGEKVTVSINPQTGNLIQSNPTDKDKVRRLKNV